MIKDFIPKHISDYKLIKMLDKMARRGLSKSLVALHLSHNRSLTLERDKDGYICRQSSLAGYWYGKKKAFYQLFSFLRASCFGKAITADFNSCEVIALYNTMVNLGKNIGFAELLAEFEHKGIVKKGYFGTSIWALKRYLDNAGIDNHIFYGDVSASENYDSYIVTLYNDKDDISQMIHTMAILKKEEVYHMYNAHGGKISGNSINDCIEKYGEGRSKVISTICISK